jgi:hypothetical protein
MQPSSPARLQAALAHLPPALGITIWRLIWAARFATRDAWRSILLALPPSQWRLDRHTELVACLQRDLSDLRALGAALDDGGPSPAGRR